MFQDLRKNHGIEGPSRNSFHTPTHELSVRDVMCQMNGMLNRRRMRVDARDSKTAVRERQRQKGTVATTHVEHPQRGWRTSWKGLAERVAYEPQAFAVTPLIFGHFLLGCGKESRHFLDRRILGSAHGRDVGENQLLRSGFCRHEVTAAGGTRRLVCFPWLQETTR